MDCCEFSSSTRIYDNCEQEGKTYASLPENSCKLPPQVHTVNVQDVSGERKTANNLKFHLENVISTVRDEYRVCVVGVVTDGLGECQKAHCLLSVEHPDVVFLDCYTHQVSFSPVVTCQRIDHFMV